MLKTFFHPGSRPNWPTMLLLPGSLVSIMNNIITQQYNWKRPIYPPLEVHFWLGFCSPLLSIHHIFIKPNSKMSDIIRGSARKPKATSRKATASSTKARKASARGKLPTPTEAPHPDPKSPSSKDRDQSQQQDEPKPSRFAKAKSEEKASTTDQQWQKGKKARRRAGAPSKTKKRRKRSASARFATKQSGPLRAEKRKLKLMPEHKLKQTLDDLVLLLLLFLPVKVSLSEDRER